MRILLAGATRQALEEVGGVVLHYGNIDATPLVVTPYEFCDLDLSLFDAILCVDEHLADSYAKAATEMRRADLRVPPLIIVSKTGLGAYKAAREACGGYGVDEGIGCIHEDLGTFLLHITQNASEMRGRNDPPEYFGAMFDNAPVAYLSLDEDGRLIDANAALLEMMDYPREDVMGRCFDEFVADDSKEAFTSIFPEIHATGKVRGAEFTVIRADGAQLPIYFDGVVGAGSDCGATMVHCIMHDRTTLRDTQERLSTFMSSSREGFVILGSRMRVIECNDAMARLVGAKRGEVLGRLLEDIFPLAYDKMHRAYEQLLLNGEPVFKAVTLSHPIVGDIRVDLKAFKVGSNVAVIANEVASAAHEAAATGELSKFAHMMSHDIRGPLAVIQGYADLLGDECDSPYLAKIQEKARDIASYILQSVDLADASAPPATHATIDIAVFVQDIIQEHLPSVPVSVHAPDKIHGDPKRLRMVFSHLLANIAAHAKASSASLTTSRDEGGVQVTVHDDGAGISEEYIEKIFERGFSTSKGSKGLGLAIVKKTVEAHKGTVRVESSPGKGTSFILTFPS